MKRPPKKDDQQRIVLPGQRVVPSPPTLSDFTGMSWPQLVLEVRAAYQRLQQDWATELQKPKPDWRILEKAAEQMHMLETVGWLL